MKNHGAYLLFELVNIYRLLFLLNVLCSAELTTGFTEKTQKDIEKQNKQIEKH